MRADLGHYHRPAQSHCLSKTESRVGHGSGTARQLLVPLLLRAHDTNNPPTPTTCPSLHESHREKYFPPNCIEDNDQDQPFLGFQCPSSADTRKQPSQHPGIPDHFATTATQFPSSEPALKYLQLLCSNFMNCQLGQPQSGGCQICLI